MIFSVGMFIIHNITVSEIQAQHQLTATPAILMVQPTVTNTPTTTSSVVVPESDETIYLPILPKGEVFVFPTATPTIDPCPDGTACKFLNLGMHLGNRPGIGWDDRPGPTAVPGQPTETPEPNIDFLTKLRGNTNEGTWPAAVVVFTDQVFSINRYVRGDPSFDGICGIKDATVARQQVFDFLKAASNAPFDPPVYILFRIHPSPGNFSDALTTTKEHILFSGTTRPTKPDSDEQATYCNDTANYPEDGENGRGDLSPQETFRTTQDLLDEMKAILDALDDWNLKNPNDTFNKDRVYFIPANEPNIEWYDNWYDQTDPFVALPQQFVWENMDIFFTALFDRKASDRNAADVRILTPPMSPWRFAEPKNKGCEDVKFNGQNDAGYNYMENTYNTKNDGYAWHNYWDRGYESWNDGNPCNNLIFNPDNHHMIQYFPNQPFPMQMTIRTSGKPTFLSEADLAATSGGSAKDADARGIQNSIIAFVNEETIPGRGAQRAAVWLLTQDLLEPNPITNCSQLIYDASNPATEIPWHMAYLSNFTECEWFKGLWVRS